MAGTAAVGRIEAGRSYSMLRYPNSLPAAIIVIACSEAHYALKLVGFLNLTYFRVT